jgi:hypothetical protein
MTKRNVNPIGGSNQMDDDIRKFLFQDSRKFMSVFKDNNIVDPDFDVASSIIYKGNECYRQANGSIKYGYRLYSMQKRIKLVIKDCCPTEASQNVVMEIERGFNDKELSYYRYAVVWDYDCTQSLKEDAREDYVNEAIISLRRSIRFDYEPHIADENHPAYHWHPNGCTEIRFATRDLDPIAVALFAYRAFNHLQFKKLSSSFKEKCDLVEKMYTGV